MNIFDEQYRVISVENDQLQIQGVSSGTILTITNPEPENPISAGDYPPGKLIVLSDPAAELQN